jgi:hypothetical protein
MKQFLIVLCLVPSISFGQLIISGGATGGGSGDALTTGTLAQFAATTSSQFKGVISDENAPDGASSKVIMALGSLSIATGKTLTASNTLTLAGTDATTMTFPTTSATIARTDAANTFTGTQTFGAVVGTSWNGNTWATGTGTLSIAAGKTLTASNSITMAGTDATTMTFPATSSTVATVNPRVASTASSAAPTPNADTTDLYILTALTDATATFGAPTGTPAAGQKLMVRITDSGGPRTLAWNSGTGGYSASTDLALPLTTTASKTMYLMFVYNATGTAKWNLLAKLDNF